MSAGVDKSALDRLKLVLKRENESNFKMNLEQRRNIRMAIRRTEILLGVAEQLGEQQEILRLQTELGKLLQLLN